MVLEIIQKTPIEFDSESSKNTNAVIVLVDTVSEEEVEEALWKIKKDKSIGVD